VIEVFARTPTTAALLTVIHVSDSSASVRFERAHKPTEGKRHQNSENANETALRNPLIMLWLPRPFFPVRHERGDKKTRHERPSSDLVHPVRASFAASKHAAINQ